MKILFISMPSIHATSWIKNLKDAGHELFWFDVTNRGFLNSALAITEFTGWKQRKLKYMKGEYYIYKKFPNLHFNIKKFFEITENEALVKIILEIEPDMVHSFEMQSCSYPILKAMNKFPNLKWIYSCWGSDLYYYKNLRNHKNKIKNTLKRINFLITDCKRDYKLAIKLEFSGTHLGVIPGGSGYDLEELNCYKKPINQRRIILVKGYQHTFGRALNVIKALQNINNTISEYEVVVFGAHKEVLDYIDVHNLPYKAYDRNALNQNQVIKLMGESLIYIGNTISDGMPNTLLEAICMNAFPIQSNPGNATSEIIDDGENGLLIENPEDIENIEKLIVNALRDRNRIIEAAKINTEIAINRLDYAKIKQKIINLYTDL
jgi:glycosyltransferase involved in cell wall biosynthesis